MTSTYDGRKPEPPYECPRCAELEAENEEHRDLHNRRTVAEMKVMVSSGADTIRAQQTEIAELAAENATLRQRLADVNAALAPFAHYGKAMNYDAPISDGVLRTPVVEPRFPEKDSPRLLCGDFKRAILAWTPKPTTGGTP